LLRDGSVLAADGVGKAQIPFKHRKLINMKCPKCGSEYAYQDGTLWTCPECAHEWTAAEVELESPAQDGGVRDANGNLLATGDSVTLIKDLKVKGSSSTVKSGTKVKNIRLVDGAVDGHNIACKIDGIGAMYLKSEFVRKA
jgi:protein PhnA